MATMQECLTHILWLADVSCIDNFTASRVVITGMFVFPKGDSVVHSSQGRPPSPWGWWEQGEEDGRHSCLGPGVPESGPRHLVWTYSGKYSCVIWALLRRSGFLACAGVETCLWQLPEAFQSPPSNHPSHSLEHDISENLWKNIKMNLLFRVIQVCVQQKWTSSAAFFF